MKLHQFIKTLGFIIALSSILLASNSKWAPIMLGDITTFIPYGQSNTLKTLKNVYAPNDLVSVNVNASLSKDQDWVGIYPKNANNSWNNVIAWNWIPNNGTFALIEGRKDMPVGAYEARLFFHNNYDVKVSYPFSVSVDTFKTIKVQYIPDEEVSVMVNVPLSNDQDWVGIFPKNASNAWSNVIAWNWVEQGNTALSKKIAGKTMPAGEYEIRLFFHNEYGENVAERASYGFSVSGGAVNYSDYGNYDVVGPEKLPNDAENIYIYKPTINGIVRTNAPVVIYAKGGYTEQGSATLAGSEKFMKFVASKGYVVIGVRTALHFKEEFQRILSALDQLGNIADKSNIGLMGASTGGGRIFYQLRRLKEETYAANSFILSLDGYAAISEKTSNVRLLNTTTLLLQFGGADGLDVNGHENGATNGNKERYQDPRFLMALYNILPGNEKSLSYLDNDKHSYMSGSMDGKEDLRRVVGAMLEYKFENGGQAAKDVVLNNNKYEEIDNNKLDKDKYRFWCDQYGYNYCDVMNPTQNF